MAITHYSEFCGVGGESEGGDQVEDVETIAGANHNKDATDSFGLNFPKAQVFQEDITKLPIDKMPWAHLFTASPACPAWTTANGMRREFDRSNVEQLFVDLAKRETPKQRKRREDYRRSRLLMREIIRYLRAWHDRGRIVPIGFLENVIQVRLWHEWDAYLAEFRKMGYGTRLIAFNSMHARPPKSKRVGQSRNRAYLAWWHESIGRTPDWDKWLRPRAFCDNCGQVVEAVQVFKTPGADMGAYGSQWIYQCPNNTCRREVKPAVVPAMDEIDMTLPGIRLADRGAHRLDPLVPATMRRIATGVARYWLPVLATARRTPAGPDPLMVPVEARKGKIATSAADPMRTQTCRAETGLALPGFITPLRGGGDVDNARPLTDPLSTVTASGNHHGLVLPTLVVRNQTAPNGENRCTPASEPMRTLTASSQQGLIGAAEQLLVPYYGTADTSHPLSERPMGTLTTHDRFGVATPATTMADDFLAWERELAGASDDRLYDLLGNVWFRMLEPSEVGRAMGFRDDYKVAPRAKRRRVKLYGNAVTPCVAEIITSALVEALTGRSLETGWDTPAGAGHVSAWGV